MTEDACVKCKEVKPGRVYDSIVTVILKTEDYPGAGGPRDAIHTSKTYRRVDTAKSHLCDECARSWRRKKILLHLTVCAILIATAVSVLCLVFYFGEEKNLLWGSGFSNFLLLMLVAGTISIGLGWGAVAGPLFTLAEYVPKHKAADICAEKLLKERVRDGSYNPTLGGNPFQITFSDHRENETIKFSEYLVLGDKPGDIRIFRTIGWKNFDDHEPLWRKFRRQLADVGLIRYEEDEDNKQEEDEPSMLG